MLEWLNMSLADAITDVKLWQLILILVALRMFDGVINININKK